MTAIFYTHQVQIINDSFLPKTVLVEMEESKLKLVEHDLDANWQIYPEKTYEVPDTQKKIR